MAQKQKKAPEKSAFQSELERVKAEREQRMIAEQRRESMENKRNVLNAKLKEAVDKYINFSQQYGEEDMRTKFAAAQITLYTPLTEFVEVILNMEEMMSVLGESLDIVEDSMQIIDGYMDTSRHKPVGLFDRWRTKSRMKRYMNVFKSRIRQMQGMMDSMACGVQLITKEMSSMMGSFGGGKSKNQASSGITLGDTAMKMINDRKRELGVDTTESASGGGAASAPAAGGSSGGPGGLDGLV